MPRRSRCILPGLPCHVTQRGVDRRETFSSDQDRSTYLRLLRENFEDAQASLLGWCLMSNHVHLIALPRREDSLAILLRRVHGRYAQYYNIHSGRTGHLWQNRFFACALGGVSRAVGRTGPGNLLSRTWTPPPNCGVVRMPDARLGARVWSKRSHSDSVVPGPADVRRKSKRREPHPVNLQISLHSFEEDCGRSQRQSQNARSSG